MNNVKKIIIILFVAICIVALLVVGYIFLKDYLECNSNNKDIDELIDEVFIDDSISEENTIDWDYLKSVNEDIIGWIEIKGTQINYPILKDNGNLYYLKHNYKHEYISTGSIFLDKDYDFDKPSENLLIYGHRNKVGLMFDELIKYKDEAFYNEHKTIRFTTEKSDDTYEVMSAFYSRVYYTNETNVFRYYNFVNANNESDYAEFVSNAMDVSLYDTGVTATYGEQLMTLSTCDYTQENGRFVVVAKKVY